MEITLKVLVDISDRTERALGLLAEAVKPSCFFGVSDTGEDDVPSDAPSDAPASGLCDKRSGMTEAGGRTGEGSSAEEQNVEAGKPEAPEERKEDAEASGDDKPSFDVTDKEGLKQYMADLKVALLGEGWNQNRTPDVDAKARKINGYLREIARELGAAKPTDLPRNKVMEFCHKINQIQLKDGEIVRLPF